MSPHLAPMLEQAGQTAPKSQPVLEVNPERALLKRLDSAAGAEHFDDLVHMLFNQALWAEGGQLEHPAACVRRVNALLTA